MVRVMFDHDASAVLSEANLALVEELRSTREFIKRLKSREDEIRKVLLADLQTASEGITAAGVPVIEVHRQTRTRTNGDRLRALYPDAWEDCQTESTVESLRFPESELDSLDD